MQTLFDILMEIDDSIDWKNENAIIDDRILDSFGVISLVSELEDRFGIEIEASYVIPENFNSMGAMLKMIEELREN